MGELSPLNINVSGSNPGPPTEVTGTFLHRELKLQHVFRFLEFGHTYFTGISYENA